MAVYVVNGVRYRLPDDMPEAELDETLMMLSEAPEGDQSPPTQQPTQQVAATPAQPKAPRTVKKGIDPDDLANDPDWMDAAKHAYELNEGKPYEGEPEELHKYALNYMGWFNYNVAKMGWETAGLTKGTPEQKQAFLHLMDQYDETNISWGGVGRAVKGIATDPVNWLMLFATRGASAVPGEAAKAAGRVAFKAALKKSIQTGINAAIEGAIVGATTSSLKQSVEIQAGRREEVDGMKVAGDAAFVGALSFAGGTALDMMGRKAASAWRSFRAVDDVVPTPATGTPPVPGVSQAAPNAAPGQPVPGVAQAAPEAIPGTPKPRVRVAAEMGEEVAEEVTESGATATPKPRLRPPVGDTDIPFISRNMAEVTRFAQTLADNIKALKPEQAMDFLDNARTQHFTPKAFANYMRSVQIATEEIKVDLLKTIGAIQKNPQADELAKLVQRQAELEDLLKPVEMIDNAYSSLNASAMRQRQEGIPELRHLSPAQLMEDLRIPKAEADLEFFRRATEAINSNATKTVRQHFDDQIAAAVAKGNTGEAARLSVARNQAMEDLGEMASGAEPGLIRKYVELSISNVFSATTLQINLIPSTLKALMRPAIDGLLMNPTELATRKQIAATYSAIGSATKGSFQAAWAAYKFEQSILTNDAMRMMDGELAIKGAKGGWVRFIPRLLNMSDEVLSRLAYEGHVAGEAAADATREAIAKGLKGRELNKFVKEASQKAVEKSFLEDAVEAQVNIISRKGRNLNLKGDALQEYVEREIVKHKDGLKIGTNEAAKDYAREILYKSGFDRKLNRKPPTNMFWKAADDYQDGMGFAGKKYEEVINRVPLLRVAGQLFFRTPVRVFEEGMRLTPGINMITPGFMSDLTGRHGVRAQVRAQGEAYMSLAIGGWVMTQYAKGTLKGDGAYTDWKQQRASTDSDLPAPYTFKFEDGDTISFRNMDPISTPVKFMVNAMERLEKLEMQRAQGEDIKKSDWDKAWAPFHIGMGALLTSIRDANLMSGVDQAADLFTNMKDGDEGALVKFIGEKVKTLVPNTLHKIAVANDPTIKDPLTFWQMLEAKFMAPIPGSLSLQQVPFIGGQAVVPKAYDVLGNVRKVADTEALFWVGSVATEEERKKGLSETHLDIMRKLDFISHQTGTTFVAPYKHQMLGNVDLRRTLTEDGKETLYDRWNRYYSESAVADALEPVLSAGLPVGTLSVDGVLVEEVKGIINMFRDAAFKQLMAEESGVMDSVIDQIHRKAEVRAGFWDTAPR